MWLVARSFVGDPGGWWPDRCGLWLVACSLVIMVLAEISTAAMEILMETGYSEEEFYLYDSALIYSGIENHNKLQAANKRVKNASKALREAKAVRNSLRTRHLFLKRSFKQAMARVTRRIVRGPP